MLTITASVIVALYGATEWEHRDMINSLLYYTCTHDVHMETNRQTDKHRQTDRQTQSDGKQT